MQCFRCKGWPCACGHTLLVGDCLEVLRALPAESVNCCVTSPPYWGLRDYGVEGQIGLEVTPQDYVAKMLEVFREVRRLLRVDGVVWMNLGDSYANDGKFGGETGGKQAYLDDANRKRVGREKRFTGLKPKDLVGIPWRVAFALQADGWWLRQDIIWCISGGTWLYARTQKGDMPIMVRDLARLNPATVSLWNGSKWTQLLGMSKSKRNGDELEIVLRSGERISCTPTHKFPTARGLVTAGLLKVGDVLDSCKLPPPATEKDSTVFDRDAAWLAGLYVAEGSRSGDTIQISGHTKESGRWARIAAIAAKYGGSATKTSIGNSTAIRVYGKVLNALIDELVSGRTAQDKCFSPVVWRYSNSFISAAIDGYLSGDGHWDAKNKRWRLGFCRNYNLERDIRTACARLGYCLTLKPSTAKYKGIDRPAFRGELRMERTGHPNERNQNQIVAIRKARCREVYDLGVADNPHVFALASGILTHNSKPNPMPESVRDRCTKSHEYIFLLAKSERYHYDQEAILEPTSPNTHARLAQDVEAQIGSARANGGGKTNGNMKAVGRKLAKAGSGIKNNESFNDACCLRVEERNKRSVWTVTTQPYKAAHFATFPPDLIKPCILAGCPEGGVVLDPFLGSGTTAMVAQELGCKSIGIELNPEYMKLAVDRLRQNVLNFTD